MAAMRVLPRPAGFGWFERREWLARLGALLLGALAAGLVQFMSWSAPEEFEAVSVTLQDLPEDTPPKPVEPPPSPVRPKAVEPAPAMPRPQAQPAAAVPQHPAPAPVEAAPLPPTPVQAASPVAVPVATRPVEAPPHALLANPASEGRYGKSARQQIEKRKFYPDEARQLGMSGAVEVGYSISRAGQLLKAEILHSSGYPLLDQAALKAVRTARFDPMPDDAWAGSANKEFRTTIEFQLD
ncbi:MAG: energy transducer TonB [Zoogloea sp.]|nr:energy transducer TonB [Zoogloea sp.]